MSLGLDLGSSRFCSLRRHSDQLIARACRAVYAVIQDNPARRALFRERNVPFAEFGANLILFGDVAEEWSTRLRVSTIPLVINGHLQLDDRIIRQVLTSLIEGLLPVPDSRFPQCCLTLPCGVEHRSPAVVNYLLELLSNLGYSPSIASSSLAVALSELHERGMSGLGVYLGEVRSEFSIVRQGKELASLEIPRGISTLPAPFAAGSQIGPEDVLREIFATAAFELKRRPEWKALMPPVAMAISGEMATIMGLMDLIPNAIQHASWPFAIRPAHPAADVPWTVARGCLIQAELESLAEQLRPAA